MSNYNRKSIEFHKDEITIMASGTIADFNALLTKLRTAGILAE